MTDDERQLLLHVARWVADQEEKEGDKQGGSPWAVEIRRLVELIRPAAH